ncbi:hypothetical protein D3C78_1144500 [compost metagenome]
MDRVFRDMPGIGRVAFQGENQRGFDGSGVASDVELFKIPLRHWPGQRVIRVGSPALRVDGQKIRHRHVTLKNRPHLRRNRIGKHGVIDVDDDPVHRRRVVHLDMAIRQSLRERLHVRLAGEKVDTGRSTGQPLGCEKV